jgi:hypothetical protein
MIDTRAKFEVKNAYVVRDDPKLQFSDHYPVVIELADTTLPKPTGFSYTCNSNTTATFRWNSVTEAGEYAFRLDYQGPMSGNPIYNWFTDSEDRFDKIPATAITVPIIYGIRYQWDVTAVKTPGTSHPFPTWQSAFTCPPAGDTDRNGTVSTSEWRSMLRLFYFGAATYPGGNMDGNTVINSVDYVRIRRLMGV